MAKKKREIVQDKEETPWEKFLNIHKDKTVYQIYQLALISQVKPDIDEPSQPIPKRVPKSSTHQTKTMSRESLTKIIPGYN